MALIVFNLACDAEHRFEGWFASADDFESQRSRGLLSCPVCGSAVVTKQLSAPRLNLSATAEPAVANGDSAGVPMLKADGELLRELVRRVVEGSEYVGQRFAEEARRIHYKEAPARAIRGLASGEEARALADEGIAVAQLPFPIVDKSRVN